MSKLHIGRNELKNRFSNYTRFRIDSMFMEELFCYHDPDYYNSGVYGWNFDVWTFSKDILIASGYRVPLYYKTVPEEILERYKASAHEIKHKETDYQVRKQKLENLIDEFINEVSSL